MVGVDVKICHKLKCSILGSTKPGRGCRYVTVEKDLPKTIKVISGDPIPEYCPYKAVMVISSRYMIEE